MHRFFNICSSLICGMIQKKTFQVDGSSFVINEVKRFCDPVTRVIKTPKGTGMEDTEV